MLPIDEANEKYAGDYDGKNNKWQTVKIKP